MNDMKHKVLLISNYGMGFYNFKKELVLELLKLEYEVHFAVPPYEKLEMLVAKGAVYHEISIDRRGINPIKDLGLILQFKRLFISVKPDIIISHTIKPNIYASIIAKRYKIPYLNNITGLGSALQRDNTLSKVLRVMYRCALSDSSGIFFENEGNKEYFEKNRIGNNENYVVVPGAGVNTDEFVPESGRRDRSNLTFLFIGRIMKEKGVEEFFDAAEYIKKLDPSIKFQVVGFYDEPKYFARIDQLITRDVIEFLGLSNDTRVQMKNADCIVLPSYHEGMSNVLLEGASMSLPLITTDIPGCREAVHDGKTGFLCRPGSTESLIGAIKKFIALKEKQRANMGQAGREKIKKEFERKLVVNKYIEKMRSVLEESVI